MYFRENVSERDSQIPYDFSLLFSIQHPFDRCARGTRSLRQPPFCDRIEPLTLCYNTSQFRHLLRSGT